MNLRDSIHASILALAGAMWMSACNSEKSTAADGECPGDTATLVVTVAFPEDASSDIEVTGPEGFSKSIGATTAFTGAKAGLYVVSGPRIKVADNTVGKAFYALIEGNVASQQLTLASCKTDTVAVEYRLEPGSEKLWVMENGIKAFASASLAASGTPEPAVKYTTPAAARNLAFDAGGNLWFTHAEGISMLAMRDLGTSSAPVAVRLTGSGARGVGIPGPVGLAFDAQGNMWVAFGADKKIARFTPSQLAQTGSPVPALTLSGEDLQGPGALAFDAEGNLWATSSKGPAILKYAASRLAATYAGPADISITAVRPAPVAGIYPDPQALAFDGEGNLWVSYGGSHALRITQEERLVTKADLVPGVVLDLGVLALASSLVFDGGGRLWMPGSVGKLVASDPAGLAATGALSAAIILTPGDFRYAEGMAFNPAPDFLPLRDH